MQIIACIGLVIGELELVSALPTFDPVGLGPEPPLLPVVSTLPSSSSLRVTRVRVYIQS